MEINIQANEHFIDYLNNWDKRFYYIVGGYGSSKSYHTALKLVLKALQEKRRILVVRAVYRTIKESCFSLLKGVLYTLEEEMEANLSLWGLMTLIN